MKIIKDVMLMKRTIVIISTVALIALLALLLLVYMLPILRISSSQTSDQETLLMVSQSPDDKYSLEAYRTEPGATVDFSIKVYVVNNNKSIIYDAYHEYEAEIVWLDNTTVSINGKSLDISQGERYDWRKQ